LVLTNTLNLSVIGYLTSYIIPNERYPAKIHSPLSSHFQRLSVPLAKEQMDTEIIRIDKINTKSSAL
jgi:hypothetical protein